MMFSGRQSTTNGPKIPGPPECLSRFTLESPRGPFMATRTWGPTDGKRPSGIIILVHGGGWHSGYYEYLAQYLVKHLDLFVAAYDQPGNGWSDREPFAPKGYAHVHSMDDWMEDLFAAVEWAREQVGDDATLPLFLLGESYGAVQVLQAAFDSVEYNLPRLDGVIVLGGLLRLHKSMLPPWPFNKLAAFLMPCCAPYYPRFKLPALDTALGDSAFGDSLWAQVAREDPRVITPVKPTLAWSAALLTMGNNLLQKAAQFPVPLLAVHGARDVRADIEAVYEFTERAPQGELIVIQTNGHMLLQDRPEVTKQVMETISSCLRKWID